MPLPRMVTTPRAGVVVKRKEIWPRAMRMMAPFPLKVRTMVVTTHKKVPPKLGQVGWSKETHRDG